MVSRFAARSGATSAARLLPTVNKRSMRLTSGQPTIIDNKKGFCISATDPVGNTTTGSYDGQGNLLRVTWTVDTVPPTVTLAYNPFGQVIGITNAADANGRQRVTAVFQ